MVSLSVVGSCRVSGGGPPWGLGMARRKFQGAKRIRRLDRKRSRSLHHLPDMSRVVFGPPADTVGEFSAGRQGVILKGITP